MGRRYLEFYCRTSGGGCGGYLLLPITSEGTYRITFHCPKCKHQHERSVIKGEIVDRCDPRVNQQKDRLVELMPPLSSWTEKPRTRAMEAMRKRRERKSARWYYERDADPEFATVASSPRDFVMRELWIEHFGDRT